MIYNTKIVTNGVNRRRISYYIANISRIFVRDLSQLELRG